ncbi:Alpha/Beta hydrolase protein [Xylaria palmicola]|nr:Alpha/Beta hydrolase protein [Xylaria palmicola]
MADICDFNPAVPQAEVDRLWRKLEDTRLPKQSVVPDAAGEYGPPLDLIHKFWFELSRCIDSLSDPGDGTKQAFHVVVSSIPGFTWSSAPPRDWTLQDTARVFDQLMRRLGYSSYAAQGGDWGALGDLDGGAAARESGFLDDLCTTLCLYFFTGPSIMTSALCYTNNVRHEKYVEFNTRRENRIEAPFGFSSFTYDITPVSMRAAATTGNCQWFREYDHGGHFAALESPGELVRDLRECFSELYKPG